MVLDAKPAFTIVDLSSDTLSATYNGATLTTNIDDTAITLSATAVLTNYDHTITAPTSGTFTITPNGSSTPSVTFAINDPSGTLEQTVTLGSVINSANSDNEYTIQLTFTELPYTLNLGSATVAESVASTTYTLPACTHFLPTISSTDAAGASYNIAEAILPAVSSYYETYDSTDPTATSDITAVVGVRTLSYSSVTVTVQDCTTFAGGNGLTTTTPWEIDNDMRLDLMSRLVNGDAASHTTYGGAFYALTADLDMNNANAPWGDGDNGRSWVSADAGDKNGFVPIGKRTNSTSRSTDHQQSRSFTGTLDCDTHTISNLTISNTNNSDSDGYDGHNIGLFAAIDAGAAITDCTLANASITGRDAVGGLVGRMIDGAASGNVVSNADFISVQRTGGLIGFMDAGMVSNNLVTNVNILLYNENGGGLLGTLTGGTVSDNVVVAVTVQAKNDSGTDGYSAGGLVGIMTGGMLSRNFCCSHPERWICH